jgi:hypothetical protein
MVTNCRKCKASIRFHGCTARKRIRMKTYVNVKKRGGVGVS